MQATDLSEFHFPVSKLFKWPTSAAEWEKYKLTKEQVEFFNECGYLSDIKFLEEEQIKLLTEQLGNIMEPEHPGHHLYYEFHSNESTDPNSVLFHALGMDFMMCCGTLHLLWPQASCLAIEPYGSGTTSFSANLPNTAE
jgi:hypothetical protein